MEQILQRRVTVIPRKPVISVTSEGLIQRKRVCAYCRVSTKQDQQLDSLDNQTTHYTQFIQKHADWDFAGIYADEGLTGTMLKKRDEFKRMVADGKAGKFDLILIKSIARYCRNTVDSLKTARELAACGVVIYFEKENLYSNNPKSELAFTIFSSFAQEESRSISDNVARGYRMKYKTGMAKIRTAYGYASDGKGGLNIIPEEADIVKRIFSEYLDGVAPQQIAQCLNAEGVPTKMNKSWRSSVIQGMLQNEKYMGDTCFQKVYTIDFLTHKTVKNNGELESYYMENTHQAIIDKKDFALIQTEIKRRNELRGKTESGWTKYSGKFAFSNLLRCGSCGARYKRHAYQIKGEERHRRVWACQTKGKKTNQCNAHFSIPETELEFAFNTAIKEMLEDETILNNLMINVAEALDTAKAGGGLAKVDEELNQHRKRLYELIQIQSASLYARKQIDEEIQNIMRKSEAVQAERDKLITSVERSNLDQKRLEEMKEFISENNPLKEFDKDLFRKLIRHAVIHSRNDVEFVFYTGISRRILLVNADKAYQQNRVLPPYKKTKESRRF